MFTTVIGLDLPNHGSMAVVHSGLPYGHIQDGAEEAN